MNGDVALPHGFFDPTSDVARDLDAVSAGIEDDVGRDDGCVVDDRPDVQVVNVAHPGRLSGDALQGRDVDPRRRAFHQHVRGGAAGARSR